MKAPLVLLVDRDRDTRLILRAALEHAGYGVLDTGDGEEASRLARDHAPAVVVGDFPLEIPGGRTLMSELTGGGVGSRVPILSVTARAMASEQAAARAVADEVLLKPVRPRAVVAAVARLIRGNAV